MSELPQLVRVKRKRGAEPTPDLFLEERSSKRSSQTWQFRLQQLHPNELKSQSTEQADDSHAARTESATVEARARRREFRLAIYQRNLQSAAAADRKRKAQNDVKDIPTFIEATEKKRRFAEQDGTQDGGAEIREEKASTSLKRPSANAKERQWRSENWKQTPRATSSSTQAPPPDRMVDALQRFALEEAARDEAREKPKVTAVPKKPVQRFKERNPDAYAANIAQTRSQNQNNGQEDVDMDMESSDDDDYVYDTYIRTKEPVMLPTMDNGDSAHDKIGYIVITEQDQTFWETYFEEEESDKEFDTDDEDENAEGYYGADYPEDEVASDDEYDRGAYGYRNAGSDDEQWDSDTGAWSDGEDVMQNPWKKYPWMRSARDAVANDGEEEGDD